MIMVDIYFPAVDEVFNVEIDENSLVSEIMEEVSSMMCRKYKTENDINKDFILCSMDRREILKGNNAISFYKIRNGSRLLLV